MNHSFLFSMLRLVFLINLSNNSTDTLVFLMASNSFIQSASALKIFRSNRYMEVGNKWIKGRWDKIRFRHICWWPPNGICHAGNDIKTIPCGFRYLFKLDKNSSFSVICSNISWQIIISKLCSNFFRLNISDAINSPFVWDSLKKVFVSLIRLSARSTPTVLHPISEKGS